MKIISLAKDDMRVHGTDVHLSTIEVDGRHETVAFLNRGGVDFGQIEFFSSRPADSGRAVHARAMLWLNSNRSKDVALLGADTTVEEVVV